MTERTRDWIQWLILLLFVYFAGQIVTSLVAPVFYWLSTVASDVLPGAVAGWIALGLVWCLIACRFAALGFVYAWLLRSPWRRAGLAAWAVFELAPVVLSLRTAGLGLPFVGDAVVALAAASFGAWFYDENRHHPHLIEARRAFFRVIPLEGR